MSRTVKTRSLFTTLLGVVTLLLGGLGSLFSLFALLLAFGKPYANAFDPLGIFLIFILPPVTLLAGVGLLLRQRWARWWMILLMIGLVGLGVKGLVAPTHEIPAYAPVPGPAADALNQTVIVQSITCITVGILVLIGLFSTRTRSEFSSVKSDPALLKANSESWRVGHRNRDLLFYEESYQGDWRRIEIEGEMLSGSARHIIDFANSKTWQGYPEWARHRRDEIIARIKNQFGESNYEYQETGAIPRRAAPVTALTAPYIPSKPDGTILPASIFLICVTVVCFWFISQGVKTNEIRLPARGSGNQRVIRAEKPALFWTSIGLLGIIGTTSTGTAIWLVIHRIRSASQSPNP